MKKITYLFDPLCGWCYGASPAIRQLMSIDSLNVELAPTGLFVGGGRVISTAFAEYAWSNDMRIAQMTGQQFTQAYKQQVLGNIGASFDSTFATLALTAVKLTAPDRELEVLNALQEARYIKGLETSYSEVVVSVLREMNLLIESNRLATLDDELQAANSERLHAAQQLMRFHGLQGVPALVVHGENGDRLISNDLLFGDPKRLVASIVEI
jgi:putative protein-disulfide isomerase